MDRKRLLILRQDNIGDCFLFSGTLKYYRGLYPEYVITLAVKNNIIPLFENSAYVDFVINFERFSYNRYGCNGRIGILSKVVKRLKKYCLFFINKMVYKWDVIICPVRSITLELLWVLKSLNAKQKIGILGCTANLPVNQEYKKKRVFTKYYLISKGERWQHELVTNLNFMKMLGAPINNIQDIYPSIPIYDKNIALTIRKYSSLEDYTILAPFANSGYRELGVENINDIISNICDTKTLIIVGTENDLSKVSTIENSIPSFKKEIINLCGQTNYQELFLLIKNARKVICVESAILHFSISLNKQTYAIVGGGHWGRFFPWGNENNVHWLNKKMDCFQCNWKCIYGDFRCIKNIII